MAITRKLLGAAVSVLSLASAAAYAEAAPNAGTSVEIGPHASIVRFNDLNLDQPRDAARLLSRINAAADNVCGPRSLGGYFPSADYVACYSDAVSRAIARVDRPSVTALFQERGSRAASRRFQIARQ